MPERDPRRPGLNKESALVADLLKLLLKIRAKEINVASRLLARSDDREMLAAGVRDELSILDGWRFEQFGREDRKSAVEGKSVSVRVDLGGRRIIKNKKQMHDIVRREVLLSRDRTYRYKWNR